MKHLIYNKNAFRTQTYVHFLRNAVRHRRSSEVEGEVREDEKEKEEKE